jgi:hypothetical protein
MLVVEKSLALNKTVQQMGVESIEEFALAKTKEKLLNEMATCTTNIEKFEKKYGINYADFCLKFQQLNQGLFEKEEDSAEWNAELKQFMILKKRLARLS